ncbi:MAG: hypothetical protein IPP91_16900 [Betaproteobacteria bacterium]|nr:hypothetical protein [Betaproteobacteria bacterium]
MNRILLCAALCLSTATAFAERVSNDLLSYASPPDTWNKEVKARTYTSYSTINRAKGTYCQIFVLLGVASKGSITADFDNDWKASILSTYAVTTDPRVTESELGGGWRVKTGVASFAYSGGVSAAMLTTISGHGRTTGIVAVTNSEEFAPAIQSLLGSVQMNKVVAGDKAPAKPTATPDNAKAQPAPLQGYMEYNPFTKTWTWKLRYPPPSK